MTNGEVVDLVVRDRSGPDGTRPTRLAGVARNPSTAIAAGAFVVYGLYALTRYRQFLTAGYDLGIFDQAVRAYAHLRAPLVPLKGDHYNIFADHFHPIIATVAPLYWIWDDPRVLLLVQAALVAASCIFVFRFASRRLATSTATALTIGYALGWPIQGLVDFDFHEIAFAIPLLAWAFDALDRRSDRELVLAAVALLLVREDLGAVVAVIGALRAFQRNPRRVGLALCVLGVGAFTLIVGLIIPKFADGAYSYWDYPSLGAHLGDAPGAVLGHPLSVVGAFFQPSLKLWTLMMLLAPLLLLSLVSPLSLAALPILAERFLSSRESLWTTSFHYNAPVWVILSVGAVDGLSRLARRARPGRRNHQVTLTAAVLVCAFPVLMSAVRTGPFPLARLVDGSAFVTTPHMVDQSRATAAIPAGTCVAVDDRLAPRLIRTNRVTVPDVPAPAEDFYVLDFSEPFPAEHSAAETTARVAESIGAEGYVAQYTYGDLVVFVSPSYRGPTSGCSASD